MPCVEIESSSTSVLSSASSSATSSSCSSSSAPAAPATRLNSKLIMPFVQSTMKVFATMVGVKAEIGRPRMKDNGAASFQVSGIIGFSGDIIGSVVISFQLDTAAKLVEAFAGMEVPTNSPDFCDAIGELANMIAGSAKKDLGLNASISVPTVIVGTGHHIARLSGVPCIVIPCTTPFGEFAVEVNIKPVA